MYHFYYPTCCDNRSGTRHKTINNMPIIDVCINFLLKNIIAALKNRKKGVDLIIAFLISKLQSNGKKLNCYISLHKIHPPRNEITISKKVNKFDIKSVHFLLCSMWVIVMLKTFKKGADPIKIQLWNLVHYFVDISNYKICLHIRNLSNSFYHMDNFTWSPHAFQW